MARQVKRDVKLRRCPRLRTHVIAGRIWVDEWAYVGRAADGVEVQLGNVGAEGNVERYLAEHPEPKDW